MGCPSADTARHWTVCLPGWSVSAAMLRVAPSTLISPVLAMCPSGAMTLMVLEPGTPVSGALLSVMETLPGLVVMVCPSAGLVEARASCACAGAVPARAVRASIAVRAPVIRARRSENFKGGVLSGQPGTGFRAGKKKCERCVGRCRRRQTLAWPGEDAGGPRNSRVRRLGCSRGTQDDRSGAGAVHCGSRLG